MNVNRKGPHHKVKCPVCNRTMGITHYDLYKKLILTHGEYIDCARCTCKMAVQKLTGIDFNFYLTVEINK